MKLISTALIRGILLPFRVYFQPVATFSEATQPNTSDKPNPSMFLVFAIAWLWIPFAMLVAFVLWGWPTNEITSSAMVSAPLGITIVSGLFGLRLVYQDNKLVSWGFDWSIVIAFGLFMNLGFLVYSFMADDMDEHRPAGEVEDSQNVDWPVHVGAGMLVGVTTAVMLSGRLGVARYVHYAVPGAVVMIIVMLVISREEVRAANLITFSTAGLFATHLVFQPVWFVGSLLATAMLPLKPTWGKRLWQASPAHWNEFCYIDLPGLHNMMRSLVQQDATYGMAALRQLQQHPFYGELAASWLKDIHRLARN